EPRCFVRFPFGWHMKPEFFRRVASEGSRYATVRLGPAVLRKPASFAASGAFAGIHLDDQHVPLILGLLQNLSERIRHERSSPELDWNFDSDSIHYRDLDEICNRMRALDCYPRVQPV